MAEGPRYFDVLGKRSGIYTLPVWGSGVPPRQQQIELSPNLTKGERGGVIAPPMIAAPNPSGGLVINGPKPLDQSLIRTALLFVDRIDVPDSANMSAGVLIDDLTAMGIASRSRVRFGGDIGYDRISIYPWLAFKDLDKREPGRWSIWQEPEKSMIPSDELSPDLAFQIELQQSFVAPDPSVPFDDVLSFRDRHRDELTALRHYIEEAVIKLSNEGDPRAINIEIEKMDAALADYLKKARQSNVAKVVQSLTAEMDWSAAVRGILGGGGGGFLSAAQNLSLTATAAVVTGGLLAGLSIKSAAGLKKADPSPFRYIVRTEREFG